MINPLRFLVCQFVRIFFRVRFFDEEADRFAEREKLQDQLRGLEAALRAADEGLRHITEYKSETSAAAYTREQEPMFSRTPSLNFELILF